MHKLNILIKFSIFIASIFLSRIAYSQEKVKDSIELKLELCDNDSLSTHERCNCYIELIDYWDKELNNNYKLLIKTLTQPNREFLKKSQKKWIEFRDSEFELIDKIYFEEVVGTMYHPWAYYRKMKFVETRALELKRYYELVSEDQSLYKELNNEY